ncbi:MAG: hypothetical protein Q9199_001928, partial [Rusavskia elegans]
MDQFTWPTGPSRDMSGLVDKLKPKNIVWITPLINRSDQGDIPELGAGGGGGDLTQTHELEITDPQTGLKLIELCRHQIRDDKELTQTLRLLEEVLRSDRGTVPLDWLDTSLEEDYIPLEDLAQLLIGVAGRKDRRQNRTERVQHVLESEEENTRRIVRSKVMRTKSWTPEISIEGLFGHLCTGTVFSHDHEMRLIRDVGTVPHPKSSPQRSACERGESATPKSSRFGPRPGRGPLSLQPASGRSSPAIGEASDENLGSFFPNKCQGTTDIDIGTPTICRVKLGMPSRERPEPKDGGFLARSFLGWLDPQGGESGRTKRTVSEKIDREHVNTTTKRKRNISPRTARSGPDDGELGNSPIDRIHQQQGQSNPLD